MEQTSTKVKAAIEPCLVYCFTKPNKPSGRLARAYQKWLVLAFTMLISTLGFAHTVDSYSAVCGAGPQYAVTAVVSSVNTSSNYRWQWKNTSGAWVCFVNGANTINGTSYNVSGAVFNLTTTPGPLVFTNPGSGLQGLEIRMVISDGAGVDPCTLPAGNTWTSSVNHFINITGTPCASTGACSCPGNLVTNPSFESGTTGWSWSGGNFNAGTGAVACGSFSGDFQITNTASNWVSQTIGTDLAVGTVINAKVYAGTHNNTIYHGVAINFFDANWNWLSSSVSVEVKKVLSAAPVGPQLYTFSATVPVGAKYTQVGFSGAGDWIKTDQWCVTTSAPVTGCIGDYVWNDANGNGLQDATETGLGGVTVNLKNTAGTVVQTTTTNTSGFYQFGGIVPGTYTVEFVGVAGYGISPANQGADDTKDSDVSDAGNGNATVSVVVSAGACNNTIDAGFCPTTLQLGNRVWADANNDGLNNNGEIGIGSVILNLYKDNNNDNVADGAAIATTTTDANGFYSFNNLTPGNYIVGVITPATYVSSAVNGGDPDNDINLDDNGQVVVGSEVRGLAITLIGGTEPDGNATNTNNNITYDFGFYQNPANLVSLGNQVYVDRNDNGLFEPALGDFGYDGAIVRLYADNNDDGIADGAALATQTTAGGGFYNFTNLAPGKYFVQIESVPSWMFKTTVNGGDPDNDVDNDNNGLTQNTTTAIIKGGTIALSVGGEPGGGNANSTYDFGIFKSNGLGDFVFLDANANGVQDAGEGGIANVTVNLRNTAGALLATTTTDANGYYFFYDPAQYGTNNYNIEFITPAGYTASPANQGTDDAKDSDPVGGVITNVNVPNGTWNHTFDAGFYLPLVSLGDRVYYDRNDDGVRQADELGIAGVTVNLYRDANNDNVADGAAIATATTDANGFYRFSNLAPGNYIVGAMVPAGYRSSTLNNVDPDNNVDLDDNGNNTVVAGEVRGLAITLTSGGETLESGNYNNTYDFGFTGTGSIGDFVWNDTNGNGIQDAGEPGISGATVTLTYPDGATVSTTTNASGAYLFSNLAPTGVGQSYTVTFTTPAGYTASPANQGSDDAKDSDPVSGVVSGITLTAGQSNLTIDAGFRTCPGAPTAPGASICAGSSTTLTATGVTGASFAWYSAATGGLLLSSTASYTTPTLSANATYYVEQTIAGCPASGRTAVTVTVNTPPTSGINGPTTICANEAALFTATGAGVGAVYNWTFASGSPATATGSSVTSTWSTPGEYAITLSVTLNGCTVNYSRTIVITQAVFAAAGPDKEICQGGNVTLNGSGPAGANYTWTVVAGDPTSIDNGGNQANVLVSPLVTTVYRLTVTQNGCTRTDEVTVTTNVNNNPTANAGNNATTCAGVAILLGGSPTGTAPITSPGAALGYSWSPSTGLNSSTISNPTLTLTTPGSYTYQVIVYTLATGCSDTATVQVTVQACLNLGNFVWFDRNNNGTQDAGEPGINNATVNLYRDANGDNTPDGAAIATTNTNASGNYGFANLQQGNYIVGVVIPTGYAAAATTATSALPDNDNNTDNNGVTTVGSELRSNFITLSNAGEPTTDGDGNNGNLTLDFGLRGTGSIGDFVWKDLNGNGVQDPGEPGMPGAIVTLTYPDGTTTSTTADANGAYLFSNLPPTGVGQTYSVSFTTPPGYTASPANQGGDDTKDSDPVGGTVSGITLTAGENNTTIDAGFVPPLVGSIGDRVWNDTDRDGIQDAGEVGVAGVTVSLYNNAGTLLATTFTDALGNYLFSDLPVSVAGINYQVRFSLPAEFTFSPQNAAGSTAANNSDANVTTGRTGNITLTTVNKDRTDIDAGIYYTIPARIGDFIWNDLDKDGVQDANEPGIAGVTVTLYDNAGNPVRTTITDNNGFYQFTDVPAGTYTLGLTPPVGYVLSPANTTTDDLDNDFIATTFRTAPFTVVAGTTDLSFDGGLYITPPTRAAVGDKVWNDLNNNGLQDGNEPGVPGVTVQLYSYIGGVGTLLDTRVTDAFGNYMFNNLPPGDYYIKFSNLPAGYALVAANVGGAVNGAIDSDVTGTFGAGTTQWFNLLADETRVTVDAGIRNATALSSLGDFVWYDGNKNGIQDAGEAGVPGVTATLYNAATGAVIKTLSTDANGRYLFTDLLNGTYTVGFSNLPSGYVFTGKDLTTDAADSDVDPSSGRTGVYTISAPGTDLTVDAGIFATPNVNNAKATIGDKVWNDVNGNGVQDAGEPGVAGVTVTLYAGDGTTVIATTTTDGAGNYIFTNLDAGNYVVGFSNLPAGFTFTTQNAGTDPAKDSNPNTGTGKTAPITLAAGEINLTIDAGIKGASVKSALGDRVWYDVNSNGIQDAGENGAAGVSVTLYNAAGTAIATTVTDANGAYLFADLDAGTYTVGFSNLPAGYTATTPNAAGSTAANNSDANIGSLRTGDIVLPAATTDLNWDLGIVSTTKAALGNYVWLDANNNGIQDATEKGAPGVTVTLYDAGNNAIASAVTDATGFYMFNNLNAGTYTVGFSNLPVNTTFTTKASVGSTAANNSDVNVGTGRTDAVVLTAGQVRTDIDAGLISNFAAVGDFVWYDIDANGRQDANEPGVPGVTVNLINTSTGAVVASAVTDGKGRYFINNIPVPAGGTSFIVEFKDLPINTVGYTIKNSPAATAATNSNANPASGRTDAFTLLPGQVDLTIDAGIITDGGGPLPVTFTKLSGVYQNGISKLNWATISEQNFSHFEVEYSKDGIGFNRLGNVAGAGNSNSRIDYGFNHLQPVAGANYYRLKMVDRDGRYTYSNIVLLNVTIKGLVITAVYPNPFIDKLNVGITSATAEKASIQLFDNAGKLVYSNETMMQVGVNTLTINNLNKLAAGSYMIRVSAGDAVLTKQLMK